MSSQNLQPVRATRWTLKRRTLEFGSLPVVMGILNVTPDSFSDGGRYGSIDAAVDAALRMEDAGAGIVDIGGESTRPFSEAVDESLELRRVLPVIERLSGRLGIPLSIDTSKASVARAAVDAGAEIINDVSGLEGDSAMMEVAATSGAGVCVMHMQGTPQTMQIAPSYGDVVEEIHDYLRQRFDRCVQAGILSERICLDPGIGFGKTHEHNLQLLRGVSRFLELGQPILIGHSRKGFIRKVIGDKQADPMAGTLGVSLAMAAAGVQVIRVHDVPQTVDALRLYAASGGSLP